jgi:hypothetical protein|tara:strand:+ start:1933 stop:2382 length:450 start_codon:yes stop_codon:yes gene_type:complete
MNEEILILDRPSVNIILNKKTEMFIVNLSSHEEYDAKGFEEFLTYFKNTWKLIHDSNELFKLYINLQASKDNDLPLTAYMSLLKCIADINDTLKTNCHCICIYTREYEKWRDVYTFITNLWNPKDNRPMLFTDNDNDKTIFLQSNRLIT